MQYFLDTSALVKYYHNEAGTPFVQSILAVAGRRIRISNLGVVELQSALTIKVRSGALPPAAADEQLARLLEDIAFGFIEVYKLTDKHFPVANQLIRRYRPRLRALDAMQLAVAMDLSAQGLLDQFVVADATLAEIARMEFLSVFNPVSDVQT